MCECFFGCCSCKFPSTLSTFFCTFTPKKPLIRRRKKNIQSNYFTLGNSVWVKQWNFRWNTPRNIQYFGILNFTEFLLLLLLLSCSMKQWSMYKIIFKTLRKKHSKYREEVKALIYLYTNMLSLLCTVYESRECVRMHVLWLCNSFTWLVSRPKVYNACPFKWDSSLMKLHVCLARRTSDFDAN